MRSSKHKALSNLALQMFLTAVLLVNTSSAQKKAPVPEQYRKYFVHYIDNRSILDKVLNAVNIEKDDVGRSFALIAGISHYPNMGLFKEELEPAAEDVRKLSEYLKQYEFFDEIVVLEDNNVTIDNLEYFFQTYFPKRLKKFPKSRFLFAYSGHGMTEDGNGYLLKNTARSLTDKDNSINLRVLKVYIDEVVRAGYHVLVLLNSCYSGAVFGREPFGGSSKFIPEHPGAHAITAGGSGEITWADPQVGSGSIFFEKIIAGLGGVADSDRDGVITAFDLARYVRREVQVFTGQKQNPLFRDISRDGSAGEFFFLSRQKQIAQGLVPEFKPEKATAMGINARQFYLKGKEYYDAGDYKSAYPSFRQSAEGGDADGMSGFGAMYWYGLEVKQDHAEALRWFRKAAEGGSGRGMFNLGMVYKQGQVVPQDYNEAKRWFLKAAEADNAGAMNNLGNMYFESSGVAKDFVKAAHWYRKGADMGLTESMANLGQVYALGGFGLEKDYAEAVRWFLKSAEAGSGFGMYYLGTFYELGLVGRPDNDKAQYWFRKSAETGDERIIEQLRRPSAKFKDKLSRIVNAAYDQFEGWGKPGSETEDGYGNVEWDPILSLSNGIGSSKLKRPAEYDYINYEMEIPMPEDLKQASKLWNEYFAEIEETIKSIKSFRIRGNEVKSKYTHYWWIEKTGFLGRALDDVDIWLRKDPSNLSISVVRFPD